MVRVICRNSALGLLIIFLFLLFGRVKTRFGPVQYFIHRSRMDIGAVLPDGQRNLDSAVMRTSLFNPPDEFGNAPAGNIMGIERSF